MAEKIAIRVEKLKKDFQFRKGSNFFFPKYETFEAVKGISFTVKKGERVAFIGPNGAGKSTTIKLMTGILFPTSGTVCVGDLDPHQERQKLAYRIGTVFGQKSQLWYHLPVQHTFQLLRRIYDLSDSDFAARMQELVLAFEIEGLLPKVVRKLSLGERMRCEVVASLLHRPEILFLDEPTIGLDVDAKAVIRDLIKTSSEKYGTTVFLTSHDTMDMEAVCDRVMVIHQGALLLDRPIQELRKNYIQKKRITVHTEETLSKLDLAGVSLKEASAHKSSLEVDTAAIGVDRVIAKILETTRIRDITVEDPPMEEIVQLIYRKMQ